MHPYDKLCEHLLKIKATAPALDWLEASDRKKPRVIGALSNAESVRMVKELLDRGASGVLVMGNSSTVSTYGSADALIFELPSDERMREMLFEIENNLADECGMDSSLDEGQVYMFLRWK